MPVLPDGLDFVGKDVPLRFREGQTLVINVVATEEDGNTPINVTGRTYNVEIGPEGGSGTHTFIVAFTDALNGLFTLTLVTAGLTAGSYWWEAWENGVNFLWAGPVEVVAKVVS